MVKYCYGKCCEKFGKDNEWSTYKPVHKKNSNNMFSESGSIWTSFSSMYTHKCWGTACYYAAKNGHLESLKFCYENGCKLGDETNILRACCKHDRINCLKYLCRKAGCVPNELCFQTATKHNSTKCLKFMILTYGDDIFFKVKTPKTSSHSTKMKEDWDQEVENMMIKELTKSILRNSTIGGQPVQFDNDGNILNAPNRPQQLVKSVPEEENSKNYRRVRYALMFYIYISAIIIAFSYILANVF